MQSFFYNRKVRDALIQLIFLACVCYGAMYLVMNAATNMSNAGLTSGFDFLFQRAGYDISYSLVHYDPKTSTHLMAWVAGMVNTLAFAVVAILFTTVLSLLLAVMRLSHNFLLSSVSLCVVEYMRNVPILVHITVWYVFSLTLPSVRQAFNLGDVSYLSNRGLSLPSVVWNYSLWPSIVLIVLWLGLCFLMQKKVPSKGRRRLLMLFTTVILILSASLMFSPVVSISVPQLVGFNFKYGWTLPPEFIMLIVAVSTYSASHGSEVIRGSILAVSKGQMEAGLALGVKRNIVMNRVIIPQALHSIIPPMTSIYINVLKAAALGSVVGFMDIMGTMGGSSLNITGQAIECILIVMVSYGFLNLILAAVMGRFNNAMQLKGR
ncbi:ABC transporter permease subunit [Marinomonas rhizomae]|uniref:General L-amino acid transport system permease protein n=2 Tax=Marinomonas rhizomae TaxID=491948 RepID=A0A366IZZ1_9GAMM|nr:general L-amino acid transport system permease protein [Marinomonas rhizomae]RNF71353.1 ABC transporter permease subunit [Marinomonas rhizomae]